MLDEISRIGATGIACLIALGGCGSPQPEDEASSLAQRIEGGQIEMTAYPAVGFLTDNITASDDCAATLLTSTVAVTAKHCNADHKPMRFVTGWDVSKDDQNDSTDYVVDTSIVHPVVDLMMIHLATPVFSYPVVQSGDSSTERQLVVGDTLPAIGDTCRTLGYSTHHDTPGDTYGGRHKRSATMQVTDSNVNNIHLMEGTGGDGGVPTGGDSGGPLICNLGTGDDRLVAVNDQGHPGFPVPSDFRAIALPLDVSWVNDNLTLDLPPVTDSLYIIKQGTLERASHDFGNYVPQGDYDWSTATSIAAFPTSTSDLYIVSENNLYRVPKDGSTRTQLGIGGVWNGPTLMTAMGSSLFIIQAGSLWPVNPSNGTYPSTPLGTSDWTSATSMASLNGLLYVINDGYLYTASAISGYHTTKGPQQWGGATSMAAVSGAIYIQQADSLWKITNTSTGARSLVDTGWSGATSMTGLDGSLFITITSQLKRESVVSGTSKTLGWVDWPGAILSTSVPG